MSLPIGELFYQERPPRWRATLGLFDPRLSASEAVGRFMHAFGGWAPPPKTLRLRQSIHTVTIAPPGVGKSRGIIAPFLLENEENAVVLDIKAELFRLTARQREQMGHQIYALDPWHLVTANPATVNPLDLEPADDPESLDFARDIGESIVVRHAHDDPHFVEQAELHIGGVTAAVMNLLPEEHRHLGSVCDILADRSMFDRVVSGLKASRDWNGILARIGHAMSHAAPEERESIFSTCNRFLRFMTSPAASMSVKASNFDPHQLINGKATIYLVVPAHHLRPMAGLIRLWFSTFNRVVIRGGVR